MLELVIIPPEGGLYDEERNRFIDIPTTVLRLEHSLNSIWEWEKKHQKAFIKNYSQSDATEKLSYIKCMTLNTVPDDVYLCMTQDDVKKINDYIAEPMSCIKFKKNDDESATEPGITKDGDVITAELIMYWMIKFQIWPEARQWHLNSLLSLIHVCSVKEAPDKKRPQGDINARHRAINKARRARAKRGKV